MNADERRRAILEGAARLFRHYGPGKTTVADIAREAHVGVGTFYLVFHSKEDIIEELSSSAHVRVLRAMREVAETCARESFAERLKAVLCVRVAMFLELAERGPHACELVHCQSSAVKSAQTRFGEEEGAFFRTLFEAAVGDGEMVALDIDRTVTLLQRAYASLSPPVLFEQPPDEARRAAEEMCRLLLSGLLPRPAPAMTTREKAESSTPATKPKRTHRSG